jgi:stage III sporulation protein AC
MIFKIAAIGIIVSVLNLVLKHAQREELAMVTTLTGLVVVLFMVIQMVSDLFNNVKAIFRLY